jgi:predicted lipoprotein with Yx(FWY)xxD motif
VAERLRRRGGRMIRYCLRESSWPPGRRTPRRPRAGTGMRTSGVLMVLALVLLSGCGGDEPSTTAQHAQDVAASRDARAAAMERTNRNGVTATDDEDTATVRRKGTAVRIRSSPFGAMLFDSRRRAIYIFQNDRKRASVCYGECAEAWPSGPHPWQAGRGEGRRRGSSRHDRAAQRHAPGDLRGPAALLLRP